MASVPPPSNKNRLPIYIGVGVAGIAGYYLYSAGGNTTVAKKEVERDAARAGSTIKSELPGRGTVAKKDAEVWATTAGQKFDHTVDEAKHKLKDTEAKLEQYGRETGKEIAQKIDETDRKVEATAAKAKSSLSSWFSSGNK